MTDQYDVVIIGVGPAGLAAGLSLVRARRRTLLIDSNRPRNAVTLHSHGFITRDGTSPLELRRIGREEFLGYPGAEFHAGLVRSVHPLEPANSEVEPANSEVEPVNSEVEPANSEVEPVETRFALTTRGLRGEQGREITARAVLVATGLAETMPGLPSLRAWYGTKTCTAASTATATRKRMPRSR